MSESPFPGMDPYLEASGIWHRVHSGLAHLFVELLQPQLVPKYYAEVEMYLALENWETVDWDDDDSDRRDAIPDVGVSIREAAVKYEVGSSTQTVDEPTTPTPIRRHVPLDTPRRLRSVRIVHRETKQPVVAIEILSPVNKRPGQGRENYLAKRALILSSRLHFVEVDLLRRWRPMPIEGDVPPSACRVLLAHGDERPQCTLWPIGVRDKLPEIPVPLRPPDEPVVLDLSAALTTLYERARYDLQIDYTKMPEGPLSVDDAAWVVALMKHREATKQELPEE